MGKSDASFALGKDRNNAPVPLLPKRRPRAVQRKTTVNSLSAIDITLDADTSLVRLVAESYDCYVRVKDTSQALDATNSAHDRFVPAGLPMDFWLPDKKTDAEVQTLSVIADGTVPKFMTYEY